MGLALRATLTGPWGSGLRVRTFPSSLLLRARHVAGREQMFPCHEECF